MPAQSPHLWYRRSLCAVIHDHRGACTFASAQSNAVRHVLPVHDRPHTQHSRVAHCTGSLEGALPLAYIQSQVLRHVMQVPPEAYACCSCQGNLTEWIARSHDPGVALKQGRRAGALQWG